MVESILRTERIPRTRSGPSCRRAAAFLAGVLATAAPTRVAGGDPTRVASDRGIDGEAAAAGAGGADSIESERASSLPYRVETVETPPGVSPEVSALAFDTRGRLVVGLRLGSIWIREPPAAVPAAVSSEGNAWRRFASGLFWPLGLVCLDDGSLLVAQIPELTRVADTDGDGEADLYETLVDDWGLSGNYHEFIYGPLRAPDGSLFVGLGCASSSGGVRPPVRGPLVMRGLPRGRYGHFSPVPWRGWILRIAPDGEVEPFASGFRQPNGLAMSSEGELFCVDNQGDWIGTSPVLHVERGDFFGHPAGLVWDPSFLGDPASGDPETYRARRKPPAVELVQNEQSGSIASPVFVPELPADVENPGFRSFAGQLLIADWTHPRILRVALERVGGVWQGASFVHLEANGLRRGTHRMAFAPDGSLWLGQVARVWGGADEGLQRIVSTGLVPAAIERVALETDGFRLRFTQGMAASAGSADAWSITRHRYLYHPTYGSPKTDLEPVPILEALLSPDGRELRLRVASLLEERVHEIRAAPELRTRSGQPLESRLAAYTVRRLRAARDASD